MDKVTPKDAFKANSDRVAPLLTKLKSEGISHMIDGKSVPSVSGQTLETKPPVDGTTLATVARGNAEDIDRAATAASRAFKSWRDMPATARKKLLHRVADAIERIPTPPQTARRLLQRFAASIPGAAPVSGTTLASATPDQVKPDVVRQAADAELSVHANADSRMRKEAADRARRQLADAEQLFGTRLRPVTDETGVDAG